MTTGHKVGINWAQCDQIGRFLIVIGDKISIKSSSNYWHLFGYFEKPHSFVKTYAATSRVAFGNIWATFYSIIWSHWAQSRSISDEK